MIDEFTVEVERKDDEHDASRRYDDGTDYGGISARLVAGFVQRAELHPTQYGDLHEEEQDTEAGGERPRHLYIAVHRLVRRILVNKREKLT